jgi:4-hydroxy-2-oxoheptanedioate aldolase
MSKYTAGLTLSSLTGILILMWPCNAWAETSSRINAVIKAWEEGKPAIGRGVVDFSFDEAVRWSGTDYDFLFCDMEHRPLNLGEYRVFLQAMMDRNQILERGNRLLRPAPLLRIPAYGRELNHWMIKQALDLGLPGVIFPAVSTAKQAAYAIAGCRYPQPKDALIPFPEGMRGASPDMAVRFWGLSFPEYIEKADLYPLNPKGELLAIIQIEDKEGFKNLDEILQVKGIGMIMIGPLDLSFAVGHPGNPEHPEVEAAIQQILAKSKKAGVACGIVSPATKLVERIQQGFSWISTGDVDRDTLRRARASVRRNTK